MALFKRILVAVDGSAPSEKALATALDLAEESGAQLRLVSVADVTPPATVEPMYIDFGDYDKAVRAVARDAVRKAETRAQTAKIKADSVIRETLSHDVSGEIVAEAKSWRADLIVLGTHGRTGVARLLLGSVAEGVARHAPTAVLLVREGSAVSAGAARTSQPRASRPARARPAPRKGASPRR